MGEAWSQIVHGRGQIDTSVIKFLGACEIKLCSGMLNSVSEVHALGTNQMQHNAW